MSAADEALTAEEWKLPSRGHVGMACLILTECAFFAIFIVAHLFYLGKNLVGPNADILALPIVGTIFLLSSSITVTLAVRALRQGHLAAFNGFWLVTIIFGLIFLIGTGFEWYGLIFDDGLTIRTNLLGTTFYSLVGFHAAHVTIGLLMLTGVLIFSFAGFIHVEEAERVDVLSWYWHFVDAVWVVVLTVVYLIV